MALVLQEDMPRVSEIATRFPRLRLTLDHLGLHEGKDDEAFKHFANVIALARHPNLCVKTSCLPLYTSDAYPFRWLHPYIRQVYDAFGAQRMFWGSDLSRLPCSYRQGVTYFTEALSWLMWQMGSAPFLGGGFGHFFAYAPEKYEYPINRYTMEVKRQLDVLDRHLADNEYLAGDEYSIADIAVWPWYAGVLLNRVYGAAEFLDAGSYTHVLRWAKQIDARPAVKRGRMVNRVMGEP